MNAVLPFMLIVIPLVGMIAMLMPKSQRGRNVINVTCSVLLALVGSYVALDVAAHGAIISRGRFLRIDALSALVIWLTCILSVPCALYTASYFATDRIWNPVSNRQLRLYYCLTLAFELAMLLVPMADNLGVMWVAIESSTLASVLLVTFYNRKSSFEAGWKYIILGSVGITLALFGTVLTYSSAVGVLGAHAYNGMHWSVLVSIADKLDPKAMKLAFIFALVGYGTKAGLAPMHTWKPDAYSEAPVPAATLMGAVFVNCAVYSIMRFSVLAERSLGPSFPGHLLMAFGVFSVLLAAPFVLVQRNFRRLLAYSSIDHAGIMVAALGFGGRWGAFGALLHMVFHAIAKPLMFFSMGNIQQSYRTPYMRKVAGVIHRMPITGFCFLAGMFAITGLPPFGIFQSEFTIVTAAINAGHPWVTGLFVLGIVTIFSGFLIHGVRMAMGEPAQTSTTPECPLAAAVVMGVALCALVSGLWLPGPLVQLLHSSAAILGGAP